MPEKAGKDEHCSLQQGVRWVLTVAQHGTFEARGICKMFDLKKKTLYSDTLIRILDTPRPIPPKVVITQPSSADLLPSLTASIDTLPSGEKKKCCVIL
ncbi:hypothetical protein Y032_0003g1158 [Ancylostoma ceylanicum]|uniref:Uncharacterized protein n=1 Tax=Ancylostoma ceylanicum TaxID=53326 RepID=A0A016VY16_9BILA|nr:hypothetical protein Y032_0003g1158 [Ancylostoma ceylanicum]